MLKKIWKKKQNDNRTNHGEPRKMITIFEAEQTLQEFNDFCNKFVQKEITRILPLMNGQVLVEAK